MRSVCGVSWASAAGVGGLSRSLHTKPQPLLPHDLVEFNTVWPASQYRVYSLPRRASGLGTRWMTKMPMAANLQVLFGSYTKGLLIVMSKTWPSARSAGLQKPANPLKVGLTPFRLFGAFARGGVLPQMSSLKGARSASRLCWMERTELAPRPILLWPHIHVGNRRRGSTPLR